MLIPKNTSVLIRRIPGHSPKPIVAVPVTEPDEPKRINELDTTQQAKSNFSGAGFSAPNYPLDGSEYDEFGNHLTYLANRQKPGCAKGTGVDRSRTSATVSLKKKFKDKMSEFQHDERARQVGRSYRHRETTEREPWKDLKDRQRGRAIKRGSNNDNDTKPRDEQQPSKRRPSFRETKLPVNAGTGDKSATMEEAKKIPWSERKEESRKPPLMDRPDRHRTEMQRMNFQSRDGYGGSSLRGRDRLNGQSGGRADKWKHDLFDETSNNQTSNKEEDQIAKVEALLAS